jgi:putative selenium metabolism hydrolase
VELTVALRMDPVELAARLIRTPGISGEERRVADLVEGAMRELGYRDVTRDRLGSVVGFVGPPGSPPRILFDGHMDVVPVTGSWSVDPFGGGVTEGRLYGRGATDMKGGLAAALVGVATASDELSEPVALSASVLEETIEGVALAEVLDRLTPEAVVICEPSGLGVRIGQRGRAEVLITAHGVPAHAASPERGRNPISLAARGLQSVEAMTLPEDRLLGPAMIVVTDVVSDPYPSISLIPSGVTMRFDRRTLLGEAEHDVLEGLRAALGEVDADGFTVSVTEDEVAAYTGARVAGRRFLKAWTLPPEHRLVRAATEAVRGAGLEPQIGTWGFCTNGSESAGVRGIPTIGIGPGHPEDAHVEDESVAVDEVRLAAEIYRRLCVAYEEETSR